MGSPIIFPDTVNFPAASSIVFPPFRAVSRMKQNCLVLKQPVTEVEVSYGKRMEGSVSKLSTFGDGFRIPSMFVVFSYLAGLALLISAFFGLPVLIEYFRTGFVT